MIIECNNCETRFRLDESSIKGSGVKVKCTKCQNVFVVAKPEASEDQDAPVLEELGSTDNGPDAAAEPPIDETPDENQVDDITDPTTWGLLDNGPDAAAEPPIDETPDEIPTISEPPIDESPDVETGDDLNDLSAWGLEDETAPGEDEEPSPSESPDEEPVNDLNDLSAWGLEGDGDDTEAEPPIDESPDELPTVAEPPIDETPDEEPVDDLNDLSAWGLEGDVDDDDTEAEPPIDESPDEVPTAAEPPIDETPDEVPGDDLTDLSAWGLEEEGEAEAPLVAEPEEELDWDLGGEEGGGEEMDWPSGDEDDGDSEEVDEEWELEDAATPDAEETPEETGVLEDLDLGLGDDEGDSETTSDASESEPETEKVEDIPKANGSKSRLLFIIAAIMVIFWGVGGGYYILFIKDSGKIETHLTIENLKSIFVDNKDVGKVLAIRGKIENHLEHPREINGVKVTILDINDKPLTSKIVSLARVLTKNDLKVLSKEEIDRLYQNPSKNSIPAKESLPVMAVFTELPKGLAQFEVEVVQ